MDMLSDLLGQLWVSGPKESLPEQDCRTSYNKEKTRGNSLIGVTVTLPFRNGRKDSRNRDLFAGVQGTALAEVQPGPGAS